MMMLQCYARIVQKQRTAIQMLRRRLLAQAVQTRYRAELLRAFLRWRFLHQKCDACWVVVPLTAPDGQAMNPTHEKEK